MAIVDSSAVIPLIRIGRLGLITKLFKQVVVPSVVWKEVIEEGKKLGKPIKEFENGKDAWFRVEECEGEDADSAILEFTKRKGDILVTNDTAVYYAALSQNIKVWWLTTLILVCVKRKKISKQEGEDILLELVNTAGIHLKSEILSELLIIIRSI